MSDTGRTHSRRQNTNLFALSERFVTIDRLGNCDETSGCIESYGDFDTVGFTNLAFREFADYTSDNSACDSECQATEAASMPAANDCAECGTSQ